MAWKRVSTRAVLVVAGDISLAPTTLPDLLCGGVGSRELRLSPNAMLIHFACNCAGVIWDFVWVVVMLRVA